MFCSLLWNFQFLAVTFEVSSLLKEWLTFSEKVETGLTGIWYQFFFFMFKMHNIPTARFENCRLKFGLNIYSCLEQELKEEFDQTKILPCVYILTLWHWFDVVSRVWLPPAGIPFSQRWGKGERKGLKKVWRGLILLWAFLWASYSLGVFLLFSYLKAINMKKNKKMTISNSREISVRI